MQLSILLSLLSSKKESVDKIRLDQTGFKNVVLFIYFNRLLFLIFSRVIS